MLVPSLLGDQASATKVGVANKKNAIAFFQRKEGMVEDRLESLTNECTELNGHEVPVSMLTNVRW